METSRLRAEFLKKKRAMRVRSKIRGTALCPRLSVLKTNKYISVQLIDDEKGHTLASISTADKKVQDFAQVKKNKASAKIVGEHIAKKAKVLGITAIVFDRGPFKYHGLLAELANAAREHGLVF